MKEKHIVIKKLNESSPGKTDWGKIKRMTEEEIAKAAKADPDAPLSTLKQLHEFKRVHQAKKVNVKKIRETLHLTQAEFAACFSISERTLQQWEQHRSEPNTVARNFLRVIEHNPKVVQQALSQHGILRANPQKFRKG